MKALRLVLVLGVTAALSAPEPEFEVASVKPTTSSGGTWGFFPGEVRFDGHALDLIVPAAFDVPMQVASLKIVWTTSTEAMRRSPRFQIFAKGDPKADSKAMLRTLLKERFGLRTHTEVRQVPVYALIVKEPGKLGRWLKSSQVNCQEHFRQLAKDGGGTRAPQCFSALNEQRFGARLKRWAGTIDEFVTREVQSNLQRPVINSTGLQGNYEWEMAFGSKPDVPDIFTALEDQLGLRLEERSGAWEVMVIDEVRMATPN